MMLEEWEGALLLSPPKNSVCCHKCAHPAVLRVSMRTLKGDSEAHQQNQPTGWAEGRLSSGSRRGGHLSKGHSLPPLPWTHGQTFSGSSCSWWLCPCLQSIRCAGYWESISQPVLVSLGVLPARTPAPLAPACLRASLGSASFPAKTGSCPGHVNAIDLAGDVRDQFWQGQGEEAAQVLESPCC